MIYLIYLLQILIGVAGIVSGGFVVSLLWEWFVMPAFAVGAITMLHAIGLSITINFVIARRQSYIELKERLNYNKEIEDNIYEQALEMFYCFGVYLIGPFIVLGIGYLLSLSM